MLPGSTRTQPDASADRRGEVAVGELQLGAVDLPLVDLDGAFILAHQRLLGVQLLLGNRVLRDQHPVALHVELGVLQQRLVPRHLALGLGQLDFERPGVDFREHISCLDDLPFSEGASISSPSTRLFTVMVLSGVTEPSPVRYTLRSPTFAGTAVTGSGRGPAVCPRAAGPDGPPPGASRIHRRPRRAGRGPAGPPTSGARTPEDLLQRPRSPRDLPGARDRCRGTNAEDPPGEMGCCSWSCRVSSMASRWISVPQPENKIPQKYLIFHSFP